MQALPALGAALGAGAGSATLVGATAALGVAGTVVDTITGIRNARFQAAVLQRQAKLDQEAALRIREAGAREAQEGDQEAAAILSNELATFGSRGFMVQSPSYVRREGRLRTLAARDRLRRVTDADIQARGLEEGAAINRGKASAAKPSILTAFSAGLGVADSLIGGANLASSINARKVSRTARGVN